MKSEISDSDSFEKSSKRKKFGLKRLLRIIAILIVFILILFIVLSGIFLSTWLRNWSVLEGEKTIAHITVSPLKTDVKGGTYYSLSYESIEQESAYGKIFPWGDKTIVADKVNYDFIYGDKFKIMGAFSSWKGPLAFLGKDSLYKVYSIRPESSSVKDTDKTPPPTQVETKAVEISLNGGEDKVWKDSLSNLSFWNMGLDSKSSETKLESVTDKSRTFDLIANGDTLTLKETAL